jgi:hypothetical protein
MQLRSLKVVVASFCLFALTWRVGFHVPNLASPQLAWHSNMLLWVSAFTLAAAAVATILGMRPNNSKRFTLCCDVAYMLVLVVGISVLVA